MIIGAGGHAKVLVAALRGTGREIIGLVDTDPSIHGAKVLDANVVGDDTAVFGHASDDVELVNGVGFTSRSSSRQQVFLRFTADGYSFAGVIHPSSVVETEVSMGEGVQIQAGAIVQPGSRLGANCIINTGARVDHDCNVGDHAHIGPGAILCGDCQIGTGSLIGAGAVVLPGRKIGAGVLVGAGAVLIEDVGDNQTVVGIPGRRNGS